MFEKTEFERTEKNCCTQKRVFEMQKSFFLRTCLYVLTKITTFATRNESFDTDREFAVSEIVNRISFQFDMLIMFAEYIQVYLFT